MPCFRIEVLNYMETFAVVLAACAHGTRWVREQVAHSLKQLANTGSMLAALFREFDVSSVVQHGSLLQRRTCNVCDKLSKASK